MVAPTLRKIVPYSRAPKFVLLQALSGRRTLREVSASRVSPMAQLVAAAAVSALISTAVGFLLKAILPKPKQTSTLPSAPTPSSNDFLSVAPNPGGPCIGIFGHRRLGGTVITQAKSGNATYFVIAIANAPVTGVNALYLNNRLVTLDGSGNVTDYPWAQLRWPRILDEREALRRDASRRRSRPHGCVSRLGLKPQGAENRLCPHQDRSEREPHELRSGL